MGRRLGALSGGCVPDQAEAQARFVVQHAEYGFTANLPVEVVLGDNFLATIITANRSP